jgi:hypothetical protein
LRERQSDPTDSLGGSNHKLFLLDFAAIDEACWAEIDGSLVRVNAWDSVMVNHVLLLIEICE